tara:strand:- start:216 stop:503 length:288 start_codon:yes stop_codon:yes gene_type:complete
MYTIEGMTSKPPSTCSTDSSSIALNTANIQYIQEMLKNYQTMKDDIEKNKNNILINSTSIAQAMKAANKNNLGGMAPSDDTVNSISAQAMVQKSD